MLDDPDNPDEPLGDFLPDDAIVVRGGEMAPDRVQKNALAHFRDCGVYGVSVWSIPDLSAHEIVRTVRRADPLDLPHGQMRISTVGQIREAGYELVPTGPRHHFTLLLPTPPTDDDWDRLQALFAGPHSCPPKEA